MFEETKVGGTGMFLSASECQIQALDNLPCGKENTFLESEEFEKLDMFIVGKLFSKFEGFFLWDFFKNSWVNMNCDLPKSFTGVDTASE